MISEEYFFRIVKNAPIHAGEWYHSRLVSDSIDSNYSTATDIYDDDHHEQ